MSNAVNGEVVPLRADLPEDTFTDTLIRIVKSVQCYDAGGDIVYRAALPDLAQVLAVKMIQGTPWMICSQPWRDDIMPDPS